MKPQTSPLRKKAILVAIQLPSMSLVEVNNSLDELTRLVQTLGYDVIGRLSQKRNSDRSAILLGEGKLRELAKFTGGSGKVGKLVDHKKSKAALKWEKKSEEENQDDEIVEDENSKSDTDTESNTDTECNHYSDQREFHEDNDGDANLNERELNQKEKVLADIVVVDCELSPSQLRNLESATGVSVIDRTGVIIEIFSKHAKTRTSRLQVEMAKLKYLAPRMREANMGASDREGGGGKGAGESSLELDKRKIRDRIKDLKIEIESISHESELRRSNRNAENTVALVGYTNAGKSSLMRKLTGSEVLVANQLFATLDTTIRALHPESKPKILISDTVGFINKLPHDLVASFKSTLEEAKNASLLLFVVDASDPAFRDQLQVTRNVLNEIDVSLENSLLILNKMDCLNDDEIQNLKSEFPQSVMISTINDEDIKKLRNLIISYFENEMIDVEIFIPYIIQNNVIGEIRRSVRVLSEKYDENGIHLKLRAPEEIINYINKKIESEQSILKKR